MIILKIKEENENFNIPQILIIWIGTFMHEDV